jgi:hypothetical protein
VRNARLALATILTTLALEGCGPEPPPPPPVTPSSALAGSPVSSGDDEASRRAAVTQTAARDLACESVTIVSVLDRRGANGNALRYVLEGCGKRALYLEDCVQYPTCRYLLVSIFAPAPPAHS